MSSVPIAHSAERESLAESGRVAPAVATIASLAVFLAAQAILLLRAHHLMWESYAHLDGPSFASRVVGSIWPDLLIGVGRFCGIAAAGLALGAVGRRRMYALPALAWLALSLTHGPGVPRLPHPVSIGLGWWPVPGTSLADASWWVNAWVGTVIDYVLALLPAAVLVSGLRRAGALPIRRDWRWTDGTRLTTVAAFALCGFALWLTAYTTAVAADARYPWGQVPAVPVVVQIDWFSVAYPSSSPVLQTLFATLPFVGVTALGVAPGPLARVVGRLRTTPLSTLVLLNVLNVADAVLTWIAVDANQAVEANPVVRMLGLPAKVMLVGAISLVLYRRRPRALAWTLPVFVGVLAWHVAGAYLTAHT